MKKVTIPTHFDQREYLEQLAPYHHLFYTVFELGKPIHSEQIKTACVGLNIKTQQITFMINPYFFYNLGKHEQLFILCHEALHVFLKHMHRSYKFDLDDEISNIAQDIVINEMLVREFGFHRELLDFGMTICFVNTIFSPEQIEKWNITTNKSFEFYYNLLVENKEEVFGKGQTLDLHLGKDGDGNAVLMDDEGNTIGEIPEELAQQISEKIGDKLSLEELEQLESATPGTESGGASISVTLEKKQRYPWERIVKNKIASLQKIKEKEIHSFRMKPRRIVNLPKDLYLPEYLEQQTKENDKFNAFFFIDSSGSCIGHVKKFFNLIKTVPEDIFNIHLYSFDTKTYLLDLDKNEVKGGGGTEFSPIEERIQLEKRTNPLLKKKYPDLVFILSDGDGNSVNPEKPERWYFLLTRNSIGCIPSKANIVMIQDFTKKAPTVRIKLKNVGALALQGSQQPHHPAIPHQE